MSKYDTIKMRLYKEGIVTDKELNTWIFAYNRYADYVNENVELWNYEHEKYYEDVPYDQFFAAKSSDIRYVLYVETGMKFIVDDCRFIGLTENGGKIYIG